MTPTELDESLSELETRLERVRALYEQFFMGIEKVPPEVLRKDVDRRIYILRREQIRNTAKRFKLQTLIQRYNTFQQYWTRVCREIEEGTYRRHVERARRRMSEREALTVAAKRRGGEFGRRRRKADEPESGEPDWANAETSADFEATLTEALGLGGDSFEAQVLPCASDEPEKRAKDGVADRRVATGAANQSASTPDPALSERLLRVTTPSTKPTSEPSVRRTPWGSLSMPPLDRASGHPTPPAPTPEAQDEGPGRRVAVTPRGVGPLREGNSAVRQGREKTALLATPKTLAQAAQAGRGKPSPPPLAAASEGRALPSSTVERAATAAAGLKIPPTRTQAPASGSAKPTAARVPASAALLPLPSGTGRPTVLGAQSPLKAGQTTPKAAGTPSNPNRQSRSATDGGAARVGAAPTGTTEARPRGASTNTAARAPAPAAPAPRTGAVDAERLNQLHQQLLAAKRQTNDTTPITLDGLGRKLEATAAKLRAEHGNRQIDFDVVIRDGRPVIKPRVR